MVKSISGKLIAEFITTFIFKLTYIYITATNWQITSWTVELIKIFCTVVGFLADNTIVPRLWRLKQFCLWWGITHPLSDIIDTRDTPGPLYSRSDGLSNWFSWRDHPWGSLSRRKCLWIHAHSWYWTRNLVHCSPLCWPCDHIRKLDYGSSRSVAKNYVQNI